MLKNLREGGSNPFGPLLGTPIHLSISHFLKN